ncbi:MAG: hypothetical protein OXN94_04845 [Chloroflexota bacterium]|nr:hypothetical protein [Chloroflexota bacterium]MDE2857161.1 hypothetical protein [Chloroflexota bacterium]
MTVVRCASCEGYGWFEDGIGGEVEDCDWCRGLGYVYREASRGDRPIPAADFGKLSGELERLEAERMQELGYQGKARKPWQQAIRKNTSLGKDPYASDPED